MHICHVTNYFRGSHGHIGGADQACFRTARMAAERGAKISVVTLRPDRGEHEEFDGYSVPRIEDRLGRFLGKYIEVVKWYSLQHDPLASRAFAKILREIRPDVLHFHNFQFMGLDLIRQAKAAGAATCYSIYDYWMFCPNVMLLRQEKETCRRFHGTWCVDCLPQQFRPVQKMLLGRRRRVFDRYYDMIDRFIVLSHHSATVLQDYGIDGDRIRVVRLTLPIEYKNIDLPTNKAIPNSILFAGWLNLRKGVHILLEAMPHVLEKVPEAKLTVVGGKAKFSGEYEARIDGLMEANGLEGHVQFVGHQQPAEVEKHLRSAAVVAIPEQYENMSPLLMIEAMALGKPIVASRAGGIPEFIEHGVSGLLAEQRDPRDFARHITAILENGEQARQMGEEARKRIREICDDDSIGARTMEVYDELVAGRS